MQKRDALSFDERQEKSHIICEKAYEVIFGSVPFNDSKSHTIALYDSIKSEVDLSCLAEELQGQGVRVLKPIMSDTPGHMEFVDWKTEFSPLKKYDLTNFQTTPPEDIDVIVCPLVAFDKGNNRLGYGGGYYDRYLRSLRQITLKIGVAYSCQEVDVIPCEEHDLKLDTVVTEI